MPFVLQSRHRLLHLRAFLDREWIQQRRHSMYIRLSLQSKVMSLRRGDFMAINMGRRKNKETIMSPIICEKMHQKVFLNYPPSLFERSWIRCISTRTLNWRCHIQMDEVAQNVFSHCMMQAEYFQVYGSRNGMGMQACSMNGEMCRWILLLLLEMVQYWRRWWRWESDHCRFGPMHWEMRCWCFSSSLLGLSIARQLWDDLFLEAWICWQMEWLFYCCQSDQLVMSTCGQMCRHVDRLTVGIADFVCYQDHRSVDKCCVWVQV